jgi:2-C-methyl-D-erythritol 4-phosphate cytidylyltransferase
MNIAIIVAAGIGKRFGSDTPKQFLEINEKPVLVHTLERFENCAAIDEIILVLSSDEIEIFSQTSEKFNLNKLKNTVSGGETRAESVWNGLKMIDAENCEIVAVHDGVRPFVSSEEITKTINKAKENGAACLVAPVTDTIKRIEGEKIIETIDRKTLKRALTPQAFRFEIIKSAFENADLNETATDECFLVESAGFEISFVEGSPRNIKITHKEDLALAEFLLNN